MIPLPFGLFRPKVEPQAEAKPALTRPHVRASVKAQRRAAGKTARAARRRTRS